MEYVANSTGCRQALLGGVGESELANCPRHLSTPKPSDVPLDRPPSSTPGPGPSLAPAGHSQATGSARP